MYLYLGSRANYDLGPMQYFPGCGYQTNVLIPFGGTPGFFLLQRVFNRASKVNQDCRSLCVGLENPRHLLANQIQKIHQSRPEPYNISLYRDMVTHVSPRIFTRVFTRVTQLGFFSLWVFISSLCYVPCTLVFGFKAFNWNTFCEKYHFF